jgi:DNA-binding HxlR family transcriptional regulator
VGGRKEVDAIAQSPNSNVLADRLQRLVALGMISRAPDPSHKLKVLHSLTEPAIQLVPVLAHLGAWGQRHLPVSRERVTRDRRTRRLPKERIPR